MSHIHIPDGIMPLWLILLGWIGTALALGWAAQRLRRGDIRRSVPREPLGLTAQVSLYPLRQEHLGPAIGVAIEAWRSYGLKVWPGAMSTFIEGSDGALWPGLRDAFAAAAAQGETVMIATVSNACRRPQGDDKP